MWSWSTYDTAPKGSPLILSALPLPVIGCGVVSGYGKSTSADATLSDVTAVRSGEAMVAMLLDGTTLPEANVTSTNDVRVVLLFMQQLTSVHAGPAVSE